MSCLGLHEIVTESLEASLVFFKSLLFKYHFDFFFLGELTLPFEHFHLTAADFGLTLLKTSFNELTQIDCALLDFFESLSQLLLLLELFLKVCKLSLKLALLLIKMILVLSLLRFELCLMMHLHLQLFTSESLRMCLNSFLLLLYE